MINAPGLLLAARKAYPTFYANAEPMEIAELDGLILARAAYALGMATLRHVGPDRGSGLDQATDRIERRFMEHREMAVSSDAFQRLPDEEQSRIERELFEVAVP